MTVMYSYLRPGDLENAFFYSESNFIFNITELLPIKGLKAFHMMGTIKH